MPVQVENSNVHKRRRRIGKNQILKLRLSRKCPQRIIEPEHVKQSNGHANRERKCLQNRKREIARNLRSLELIADKKREIARQNHA